MKKRTLFVILGVVMGTWGCSFSAGTIPTATQADEVGTLRERYPQLTIDRGRIFAADGKTVFARNRTVKKKNLGRTWYLRVHPQHSTKGECK